MKNYGKELILDLHVCNSDKFNRKDINKFFKELCKVIDMNPEKVTWWDYTGQPVEYMKAPNHLKGTSAIQFISTSNITIHTLDVLKRVYLNIFTCKDFEPAKAVDFCVKWFDCKVIKQSTIVERI